LHEFILSIDLGAGSIRAGALRPDGTVFALAVAPLTIDEPQPGWAEIDPERWWQALGGVVGRVMRKVPRSGRVLGLCIAGLTRTQVLLDREGRPLGPAILFRDRRAGDEADAIARYFPTDNPAEALTAFHPLARLAWVACREPARFQQLDRVLEPKDYLNFRLTGVAAADSVTASRLDALGPRRQGLPAWVERCLDLLELRHVAPWEKLGGVVIKEAPFDRLAGVPVFAGAMDAWATAVGSGAVAPLQAFDIAGTSEVVGLLTPARVSVPGLVSLRWSEHAHQIGGPTQAGADCALWCHSAFRLRGRMAQVVERVGTRLPSEDRPIFLPYLAGERTPVWRADARGAFHNLARATGPDDCLWAVMEGVAMAARDILSVAVAGSGEAAEELRVSGGGARSDAWCQMKADVLGLPVLRAGNQETGVTGAAIAASVGLGLHADLAAAATAMVRIGRLFEPRAPLAALFAERAALYRKVKEAALGLADARVAIPAAPLAASRGARA
jgi:xylulokinase